MTPRKLRGTATATVIPQESVRKPIKLYFALLNKGWIRREFVSHQLPMMKKTPGVELRWEEPGLTYHHPIYSNRNRIAKRFLQSDCDFLMMQDDDVLPQGHNPVELVFADKDIVGFPAKVRSEHGTLDWVAYINREDIGGYVTVDMSRASSDTDLLSVDIVGTGLILIKRKVLESIKAPFMVENDEDGILQYGTDFAFCRKAKAAGFEIYTTPHRICEHIKELGLLDINGYDDSDRTDASNGPYKIAWGGWAIQQTDWHFIRRAMEELGVNKVVEFGAGLSSLLMSEKAEVWTYETKEEWAKEIEKSVGPQNKLTVLRWDGISPAGWTGESPDLVFIDGPPAKMNGGPGREQSYIEAVKMSPKYIITHDSGRDEERWLADTYLRGKYVLMGKSGNHQTRCELWKSKEN